MEINFCYKEKEKEKLFKMLLVRIKTGQSTHVAFAALVDREKNICLKKKFRKIQKKLESGNEDLVDILVEEKFLSKLEYALIKHSDSFKNGIEAVLEIKSINSVFENVFRKTYRGFYWGIFLSLLVSIVTFDFSADLIGMMEDAVAAKEGIKIEMEMAPLHSNITFTYTSFIIVALWPIVAYSSYWYIMNKSVYFPYMYRFFKLKSLSDLYVLFSIMIKLRETEPNMTLAGASKIARTTFKASSYQKMLLAIEKHIDKGDSDIAKVFTRFGHDPDVGDFIQIGEDSGKIWLGFASAVAYCQGAIDVYKDTYQVKQVFFGIFGMISGVLTSAMIMGAVVWAQMTMATIIAAG